MNKIIILIMGIFVLVGLVYASGVVFFGVNESGLVGEWHFDGNADDSSGNENDGTLLSSSISLDNTITYTTDSKGGSHALNFPGTIVSLNQLNGDDDLPFGQSTNYQKIAQSFVAPSTGLVRSVGARRGTDGGDPTGSVYFDIANDDGGEPGTIRTTNSYTDVLFDVFKTDAERFHHMYTVLTPGVTYWLVYRMSTTNDSNYRNIKYDSGGSYGTLKEFNGTHWNTISGTLRFNLRYNDDVVFDSDVVLPYNDFTVSWWMKRNDKVYENIFCRGRDYGSSRISVATGGQIIFESYTNNVFQKTMTTNVDDLNWHHYTLVSLSDDFKLYVDGVNTYSFGSANTDTVDQRYRYIGVQNSQMPYTYGIALNAILDEVKIYNQALSADEITQLYNDKPKLKVSSLQKGLVGHWALDGESYNSNTARVTDKTPYENHGTNYGATLTTDQMGQSDRAMSFDGSNDYVKLDSDIYNNPYTGLSISFWINTNTDSPSTYGMAIHRNDGYTIGTSTWFGGVLMTTNEIIATIGASSGIGYLPGATGIIASSGTWYHVVCAWDGTTGRTYVNGVEKASYALLAANFVNKSAVTRFGASSDVPQYQLNGSISDVRIYNRALSVDEIDTLYHSYRPKVASGSLYKGLILDMPLKFKYTKDETVGSEILTDRTPYSNDGQNYGAIVGVDYTSFDGEDDYVDCGNPSSINATFGTGSFSIGFWMKTTQVPETASEFVWKYYPGVMVRLQNNDRVDFYLYDGINSVGLYSLVFVNDGDWHYVVAVRDVSQGKIYVYVDAATPASKVDTTADLTGTTSLFFGKRFNYQWYDGLISDVRIYNRALSPSEIKLLYDKGR